MSERTIHTCPTCKLPYLGTVCESCFKSAPEVEQTAFIKQYLKEFDHHYQDNVAAPSKNYAPTPGTTKPKTASSFSAPKAAPIVTASLPKEPIYMDDDEDYDYMGRDIDVSEIPQSKPTLKVFQITVGEVGAVGIPVITDIILILSVDLDTAFSQCGYKPNRFTLEGKEITGPFKSGFILSSWDD